MKKAIGVVALVLLISGVSYGTGTLNPTNGLDVYYLQTTADVSNNFANFYVYRAHVDPGWTLASANVLVDNIAAAPGYPNNGWGMTEIYFNQESPTMFTPKANPFTGLGTGGAGTLAFLAHVPGQVASGGGGQDPWAIVNVTPNAGDPGNVANYSMLFKGSIGAGINQNWNTNHFLVAPQNLAGKTSNGVSLWMATSDYGASYLYDADNDGEIDNDTTAGAGAEHLGAGGYSSTGSWGPDPALYGNGGISTGKPGVLRTYLKTDGSGGVSADYVDLFSLSSTYTFLNAQSNYMPTPGVWGATHLAVGQGHGGAPVVYVSTITKMQDEDNALDISDRWSVLAMQDTNGDNVIDAVNDTFKVLWRTGRFGVDIYSGRNYGNGDAALSDLRYDSVSQSLVLSNAWGAFVVLALDNTTGLDVTGAIKFGGDYSGYLGGGNRIALDPTAFVMEGIPEPATLLLVGTGALGVFGYIRRRRMA